MAEVSRSYFGGSRSVNKRPDGAYIGRMEVSPKPPVDTRKVCVLRIDNPAVPGASNILPAVPDQRKIQLPEPTFGRPGGGGHAGKRGTRGGNDAGAEPADRRASE